MISRFAWCLGFVATVGCIGRAPAVCGGAEPRRADYFKDQPADALIHRLQSGLGLPAAPLNLVLSQKHRWLGELRLLVIDTTLANQGKTTTGVKDVLLADWSFRVSRGQGALKYRNLTYRNDQWYGSTYWTGPGWTRVGKDWHHPGENTPSVRRFTAPCDGRVTITGRVYKAHLAGDGVRATIRHGGRTLWTAEIKGNDAKGVEPNLTVDVRKGDHIRFLIHKLGQIFCDTTRWDPVVTYSDGKRHQASSGFSTAAQGACGWFYEMEVNPDAKRGPPRVHGLTEDFTPRSEPLLVDQPVDFSSGGALPILIVADHDDQSGIVLAPAQSASWRLSSTLTGNGLLRIKLTVQDQRVPLSLKPGESVRLPSFVVGSYSGGWTEGMALMQRALDSKTHDPAFAALRRHVATAMHRAAGPSDTKLRGDPAAGAKLPLPELDLWMMLRAEWRQEDKLGESRQSYAAATARHIEKGRLLLADLRDGRTDGFLAAENEQLERLAAAVQGKDLDLQRQRSLYYSVRRLKREIALANPLMQFGKLLFCKRVPTSYSHLVMQYYGWRARAGGGIFILDRPGYSLKCRDVTGGRLEDGCVLEPRLSYDAKRIVFSHVKCKGKTYNPAHVSNTSGGGYYHIWEINVDGTGLRPLTGGDYDDLMPTYLPDGGIAFSSTRRRGYARCFGGQFSRRWDVYTLHRMDGDGQNIRTLSFHDTNEWFPTVSNTGRILYARWDYIDRDAVTHQNLWSARPDGTNPITVWGNATASPHCSFQAKPIPGSSKIVLTAAAHHSISAGSIAVVDPTVDYDGHQAITRITPEIPFPEAESRNIREYYTSPWPLSEKYFLVGYSPVPLVWEPGANAPNALGIYLLDRFGNRELIYRDPQIGSTNPCPLVRRPVPPVIPSELPPDAPPAGEMLLMDVYRGLGDIPRGSIKQLRIIQIFPKTTPLANNPPIGVAGEENGRAILGTVPVDPDGSARFIVPAGKPILFQALDRHGLAYQMMRSVTYVQPGERLSCVGCHENRMTAPTTATATAVRRRPSQIDPGPLGGRPFSYVEMVQPVLDKQCVRCHGGEKTEGKVDLSGAPEGRFSKSYNALCRDRKLVPRFSARNQIQVTPAGGVYGAWGSGLMKLLRDGDGHEGVKLSSDDLRRLAAWIDCNAIFYGTPDPAAQARQRRGQPVPMPEIQ